MTNHLDGYRGVAAFWCARIGEQILLYLYAVIVFVVCAANKFELPCLCAENSSAQLGIGVKFEQFVVHIDVNTIMSHPAAFSLVDS